MHQPRLSHQIHRAYPAPGTVVSVPIALGFRHKGIVSDRWLNGKPMVISGSNRMGYVVEETWDVFSGGIEHRVENIDGVVSGMTAVMRARSKVGTTYSLLEWNCDHVVHYAVGLEPRSPQIAFCVAGLALFAIAVRARL